MSSDRLTIPTKDEVIALVERGIERRAPPQEPFNLTVGTSWNYVDAKFPLAKVVAIDSIGRYALAQLDEARIGFTTVGGLTMGATPVTVAIALAMAAAERPCSWFEVCKVPETKYSQDQPLEITGARLQPGDRVLVTEDVTSTGTSALKAIAKIRAVCADQGIDDVEVAGVCTVLDRGRMAAQHFADMGIAFVALTTYEDVGLEPVN